MDQTAYSRFWTGLGRKSRVSVHNTRAPEITLPDSNNALIWWSQTTIAVHLKQRPNIPDLQIRGCICRVRVGRARLSTTSWAVSSDSTRLFLALLATAISSTPGIFRADGRLDTQSQSSLG